MFKPLFSPILQPLFEPAIDGNERSLLRNGLISYWKMEEASGARADATGNITLSDVNTVGQAVGKIGNSGDFIAANSESLITSGADKTKLSFPNQSYSFVAWVYANSLVNGYIFSKWGIATQRQYRLLFSPIQFRFEHMDAVQVQYNAMDVLTTIINQWYFVATVYDHDAQDMTLYVDTRTPVVTPVATGSATVDSAEFYIGSSNGATIWFDGRIDEVGAWSRALSANEVAQLYNGGAGVTYPFI